jgi:hypothetical protein
MGGQIAIYERLDVASSAADLKGIRSAASDTAVLYKQATKMMLDAVGLAVVSALVPDPADSESHMPLAMTAADKNALVRMLKDRFGGTLVKTIGGYRPC